MSSRPQADDVVVEVRALVKQYPKVRALDGLDLTIRRGEVFALLGPNGAGKTTLINIVAGVCRRTSGEVLVLGHDVERDYRLTRRAIGLVPQEINFDPFFTPLEILRFQRGYFGLPPDDAKLEGILRALQLWDKRDASTRSLSGGMKRRLLTAKALVHDPPIVFLDEPTAGVDVNLRRDLWAHVRQRREAGTTFILTTHYLEEAEQLADRIGVIDHGKLLVVDRTSALLERLGRRTITVVLERPLSALPASLQGTGARLEEGGEHLVLDQPGGEAPPMAKLLEGLVAAGLAPRDIRVATPSLEQIFVDLVGGRERQ